MENFDALLNATETTTAPKKAQASQTKSPTTKGKRRLTKEEWVASKKQEREDFYELIDKTALEVVSQPERMVEYLNVQSNLDRYSLANSLLVTAQNAGATQLASFDKWKEVGAKIQKGEQSLSIFEPGEEYTKDDGSKGVSYHIKLVFDISQTDHERADTSMPSERALIGAIANLSPVPVQGVDNLSDGLVAHYHAADAKLYVQRGAAGDAIARAMFAEVAKIKLEGAACTSPAFASYATSYMLAQRYGVDTSNYNFKTLPENFSGMDAKQARQELAPINTVYSGMVDELDKAIYLAKNKGAQSKDAR